MSFLITCPNCGAREHHEFWYGIEYQAFPANVAEESQDANYDRVWLRTNAFGVQQERWYHFGGCGRWVTITRDTRDDTVTSE
jgi:methylglutamate dehydrogenase subunit B